VIQDNVDLCKEIEICHLQAVLKQRQPYISQQLRALRDAGLVDSRREGLYIYYRLCDPHVVQALDAILGPAGEPRHRPDCTCPACQGFRNQTMIPLKKTLTTKDIKHRREGESVEKLRVFGVPCG